MCVVTAAAAMVAHGVNFARVASCSMAKNGVVFVINKLPPATHLIQLIQFDVIATAVATTTTTT